LTRQTDGSLRARLLISSIGIAIAVSTIFIIVAYRLTVDLGESAELQSIERQTQIMFSQLQHQQAINPENLIASVNTIDAENLEPAPFHLELIIKGKIYRQQSLENTPYQELMLSESYNHNSSGIITLSKKRFMWAHRSSLNKEISIILIRPTDSLDRALQYIVRRLSVTAFLTFWIALWSALVLSAMIFRRIEKNNEELAFIATHDSLTKLPNRLYLIDKVNNYTESFNTPYKKSAQNKKGALLMIDLDRFKEVNDTLGHAMGDELLIALAKRFREQLSDSCLLVRTGGDEFIIWCKDMDAENGLLVANQIIQSCKLPVVVNNTFLESSASIGIACFPQHGKDVDTLVKCADIAMYQAKRQRQGVKLYDAATDNHSLLRVKLRGELSNALKHNQFILHYQPKVELSTGAVVGVEALARWNHPKEGLIQPNSFIDLIEQSGMINEFTRYILLAAVKQIRQWIDQGIDLTIAVNISPYNLLDPSLTPHIRTLLETYQIPADKLEIELTETASMIDIQTTKSAFNKLREVGVQLSVDDFGTGMSSLAYLKELDVDFIKIDRSFIINMSDDHRDAAIVKATIDLVNGLGRSVIAEGIENEKQATQLQAMGCGFGQGYYFAKPMAESALREHLNNLNDTSFQGNFLTLHT
jgi:diguanylate cyclase (GGDEF)-like protein